MSTVGKGSQLYSGFSPLSIPGCQLWLDAADRSTLTLNDSTLTGILDKSGSGRTVTVSSSPTYNATGFNGYPTLTFASGNALATASVALGQNITLIAVFRATTASTMAVLSIGTSAIGSDLGLGYHSSGFYNIYDWGVGEAQNNSVNTFNVNVLHIGIKTTATPNLTSYLNGNTGSVTASSTTTKTNTINLGGGGIPFIGNLSEAMVFSTSLSTSERQQIEGYLGRKWGLTTNLPTFHPHRSLPPFLQPFSPMDVSGCALWLDAADAGTLTLSGSNLTAWNDKSGNGYATSNLDSGATYTTDLGNRAIYMPTSRIVISNFTMNRANSMFVIMRNTVTNNQFITTLWNGNYVNHWCYGNGGLFYDRYVGIEDVSAGTIQPDNTKSGMTSYSYDLSSIRYQRNGTPRNTKVTYGAFPTAAGTDTATFYINGNGSGGFRSTCYVNEIIIYNNAISIGQQQQIEGYLADKWGLRGSLPSTHPFKLTRPLTVPFNPTRFPECEVWLDAADSTSFQFSTGSNITFWLDKSGKQNDVSTNIGTPSFTSNFQNGLGAVTFPGSTGMVGAYGPAASNTPQTIFVVARPSSLSSNMGLVTPNAYGTQGYITTFVVNTPNWTTPAYNWILSGFYGGYDGNTSTTPASTSRTDIFVGSWRSGSSVVSVNGTDYAASTSTPTALVTKASGGRMTVGSHWLSSDGWRYFYTGNICEIILYSSNLAVPDRRRVESYLSRKWGLHSQLPSTHIFKTALP